MKIAFTEYYDNRLCYIINWVRKGIPKYKCWYNENGIYKSKFTQSTFPEFLNFAYTKKPKNWNLLSSEEKKHERYYYQWNTRNVLSTLNRSITNKRLTKIQGNFIEEMFCNFHRYEQMMIIEYQTDVINDYKEECLF